jgi:hypothetical protein
MRPGTLRYSNIDMALTARSIDVNAPLRAVYDQWTRFEEFPLFLEGVEEVRLEAEKFLLWKVKIAGKIKDWEAEITNQVPDQEISWESVDGSSNSGTITFEELDSQWTRVTASIGYEPEGIGHYFGTRRKRFGTNPRLHTREGKRIGWMEKTGRKRKHCRNGCFAYGVTFFLERNREAGRFGDPRHSLECI